MPDDGRDFECVYDTWGWMTEALDMGSSVAVKKYRLLSFASGPRVSPPSRPEGRD